MKNKRLFFVLCIIFTLVIIVVGAVSFFGVKELSKQSSRLQALKTEQEIITRQKTSQAQAKKDIAKYSELNEITKSIVPQDKDQVITVREINNIAKQNGVAIRTISFDSSSLGQAAAKAGTTGGTAATTPAKLTQVKPVEGIPGVYVLELVISNDEDSRVTFNQLSNFLAGLESNRRTAHVDKISITPKKDGKLVFTLTLKAYIKP